MFGVCEIELFYTLSKCKIKGICVRSYKKYVHLFISAHGTVGPSQGMPTLYIIQ